MNRKYIYTLVIGVLWLFSNPIYASGELNNLELGTAVYRDLVGTGFDTGQHYHTAMFNYFEYLSNGTGIMHYSEMDFLWLAGDGSNNKEEGRNIDISLSNIDLLKLDFINSFREADDDLMEYHGAYSVNNITPDTRASIAATAYSVGDDDNLNYTWVDMLDVNNVWCDTHLWWCEHWNGEIYRMDELRCDGLVEYSYEKNGVIVTKTYFNCSNTSSRDNIALPDQANVDFHNVLHDGEYSCNDPDDALIGEICPRIQAGENHSGSGTDRSYFDPLTAMDPTASSFSKMQFSDKMQLSFKVEDNASVKAYVLVQVKKTNESTWHTLIDKYNNTWKFKEVDLTDWNGSLQSDYFHLAWTGQYDGGWYTTNDYGYDMKVTVIDQGANHSESFFSFTGDLPLLDVTISGPSSLNLNELGQFTANPSFGVPPYSYSWQYFPICPGGGGGVDGNIKGKNNTIQAETCGSWYNLGGNYQSVSHSDSYCFDVRVTVTDNVSNTTLATKYVAVSSSSSSNQKDDDETIEQSNTPIVTKLFENYPNPFNPTTTIKYQLKDPGFVSIKIYDVLGKVVANLVNQNKDSGFYSVSFDANSLPSGVYIYSIRTNEFVANKKMLLTK